MCELVPTAANIAQIFMTSITEGSLIKLEIKGRREREQIYPFCTKGGGIHLISPLHAETQGTTSTSFP